jgi:hypothetical protein
VLAFGRWANPNQQHANVIGSKPATTLLCILLLTINPRDTTCVRCFRNKNQVLISKLENDQEGEEGEGGCAEKKKKEK